METITITKATAKICMAALGELPLKHSISAYSELYAAMQVADATPPEAPKVDAP